MPKAIRIILSGDSAVTLLGVPHAFPPPLLMQRDRVGILQVEFIGSQAVDQDRTLHALLLSVDENSHELRLLQLLGGVSLRFASVMVMSAIVDCSGATQLA
ncbi:hypothetical protein [Janthinobacterium sp. RB2R34]|uniref:hypothetical protein n=1 Tax=Janthinobacterium sp. RB2R34 TaxID=3424193 RepID=UPI003F275AB2